MYSFSDSKMVVDIYPYIRRICDLSTPNLPTTLSGRSEDRFNRAIPTLLCPWEKRNPSAAKSLICLTTDLADRGIGLIVSQPFLAKRVIVGYWLQSPEMPQPWFFRGEVRRTQPIGGGFWSIGVELTEFVNSDRKRKLAVLREAADQLRLPDDSKS